MTMDGSKDITQLFIEGTAIDAAIKEAVRQELLRHKREQRPIVVYRDGRVVWVAPDEIDAEIARAAGVGPDTTGSD
jgi:hypothetical protein